LPSAGDSVSMNATWVNYKIAGIPIDEYIRQHSRYGTLKIDDNTYNVYADITIKRRPVVEGDLYQASLSFTVIE